MPEREGEREGERPADSYSGRVLEPRRERGCRETRRTPARALRRPSAAAASFAVGRCSDAGPRARGGRGGPRGKVACPTARARAARAPDGRRRRARAEARAPSSEREGPEERGDRALGSASEGTRSSLSALPPARLLATSRRTRTRRVRRQISSRAPLDGGVPADTSALAACVARRGPRAPRASWRIVAALERALTPLNSQRARTHASARARGEGRRALSLSRLGVKPQNSARPGPAPRAADALARERAVDAEPNSSHRSSSRLLGERERGGGGHPSFIPDAPDASLRDASRAGGARRARGERERVATRPSRGNARARARRFRGGSNRRNDRLVEREAVLRPSASVVKRRNSSLAVTAR